MRRADKVLSLVGESDWTGMIESTKAYEQKILSHPLLIVERHSIWQKICCPRHRHNRGYLSDIRA